MRYRVGYSVRSMIGPGVVGRGSVVVDASSVRDARSMATDWAYCNDPHTDDRVDPQVVITSCTKEDS